MAAGAATAAASLALQASAHLSMPSSVQKMARATSAALALCSARQAGVDAVRPHAHWWPARVMRPVLSLKRRLHHFNACRPKVLQSGFAPASRSYQDRARLHELQEVKLVVRLGTAPSCRVKSPVHRLKCLRTLAPAAGYAPAVFRLERATSRLNPLHGQNWHPWSGSHRLITSLKN